MEKIIVFSDLDGTLLDHNNYSFDAAKPALELIAEKKIPLILSSSKSLAEIKEIQNELKLQHPFIVENGGAICIPQGYFKTEEDFELVESFLIKFLGPSYDDILQTLETIKEDSNFSFKGFNDIAVEEIMSLTDLPFDKAQQAKTRLCSEPVIWQDTLEKLPEFEDALKAHEYKLLKGGRFYHLMGNTDKGNGVRHLMKFYRKKYPKDQFVTIGVGDSPNDVD
ncbi:MAG: HAD-IIB family hydrolase, partial [Calditrichae bacterium]|nr:HAD-IIB family hydrolase [Calditrichia bacterium]